MTGFLPVRRESNHLDAVTFRRGWRGRAVLMVRNTM